MGTMKVKLTLTEEILGTASNNPDIHGEFVSSKAPNAASAEEEIAAIGVAAVIDKTMTIFPRNDDEDPIIWDYQIKGFFKDACGMLARVTGTESSKLTAYKKVIDGLVFPKPRKIKFELPDGEKIGECQRPLRGMTAQGERIALAHSETLPAGTTIEFEILSFKLSKKGVKIEDCIKEWLNYGELRGLGQWRNSGKGRFTWEEIK